MTISEQCQALEETAAIGAVAPRDAIGVAGRDRASYLQGLLTNDIQALTPGAGCYAAWLTPQGRMLTDLVVLESGDMMLLDVPAGQAQALIERLDQFLFGEDVQLTNLSEALTAVWLHGPLAASMVEKVVEGATGLASWPEYHNARAAFGGAPVVVARVSQLGVPGFCVYLEPARAADLEQALTAAGAARLDAAVIDVARIEAGYPVFGIDMTDDTIPLEAGIEERAISFSKGCYVGQEVIIRVLHRGHGRVARKLVGLRIAGSVPPPSAKVFAGGKEVGWVTSAAASPRLGSIALGYVQRDFLAPGTRVEVDTSSGRAPAVVSDRPIA